MHGGSASDDVMSHSRSTPSAPDVASTLPSGDQLSARTARLWPARSWILVGSRTSTTLTTRSSDATATFLPERPNRTQRIEWPTSARVSSDCISPVAGSSSVTRPSSVPTASESNCAQRSASLCGVVGRTLQSSEVMPVSVPSTRSFMSTILASSSRLSGEAS